MLWISIFQKSVHMHANNTFVLHLIRDEMHIVAKLFLPVELSVELSTEIYI